MSQWWRWKWNLGGMSRNLCNLDVEEIYNPYRYLLVGSRTVPKELHLKSPLFVELSKYFTRVPITSSVTPPFELVAWCSACLARQLCAQPSGYLYNPHAGALHLSIRCYTPARQAPSSLAGVSTRSGCKAL